MSDSDSIPSSSTQSKYYRSPGTLPNTSTSATSIASSSSCSGEDDSTGTNNTGGSKYYRSQKPTCPLKPSEIFQAIPPGMSREEAAEWLRNLKEKGKDAGVDVEDLDRFIHRQGMRGYTITGTSRYRQRNMVFSSYCTPELPQAQAPSVPFLPFTYRTPDELGDTPMEALNPSASDSDEALIQLLIHFFQGWNSDIDVDSVPHAHVHAQHTSSDSGSRVMHGRLPSNITAPVAYSTYGQGDGTVPWPQSPPQQIEQWAPFAYRTPEELAELRRTKIIPGARYR
ncbi:hypothetical protein D9758_017652 [Tetrapyrgos nigripes]|uniref:Uncharacterized protein n=1 Tax=Tetrapyrgos nigripes TaxID=182062 RepID=A0A8H5CHC8_9AGAR|nr:hypothetical protein D9758_017652 [Tetrapyrgos nigripes]